MLPFWWTSLESMQKEKHVLGITWLLRVMKVLFILDLLLWHPHQPQLFMFFLYRKRTKRNTNPHKKEKWNMNSIEHIRPIPSACTRNCSGDHCYVRFSTSHSSIFYIISTKSDALLMSQQHSVVIWGTIHCTAIKCIFCSSLHRSSGLHCIAVHTEHIDWHCSNVEKLLVNGS